MAIELVLLAGQNIRLRSQLSSLSGEGRTDTLSVGDTIGSFTVTSLVGEDSVIECHPGRRYLFYILSPACPHCTKMLEGWSFISGAVEHETVTVLGISVFPLEPTIQYRDQMGLEFNLVVGSDKGFPDLFKLNGVPMTVLLNGSGVVEGVWMGLIPVDSFGEVIEATRKGISDLTMLQVH
jgi:peroxiredoxin